MNFLLRANHKKNRIYIVFQKDLTVDHIRQIIKEFIAQISKLKNGFTCLADIRNMKIQFSDKETVAMKIVMGVLVDAGMGKVARVVGKGNRITHIKMDKIAQTVGYRTKPVETIEDGEAFLDEMDKLEER